MCTSLAPLNNGLLSYGPDTASPYDYQTTATYSCNEGYGLFGGDRARQCDSSSPGDGGWSGTTPTCESKSTNIYTSWLIDQKGEDYIFSKFHG